LIIQHPLEAKRSARTDFIAKRIVKEIQISRSRKFPDFPDNSVLLFPSQDAVDLDTYLETFPVPACLVVPDGTWQFSKEMVKKLETENRPFKAVKLMLPPEYRGAFVVRKPPQPGWVSTGEAIALALDQIDQKAGRAKQPVFAPAMRKALTVYSAKQLAFAKGKETHRPQKVDYVPDLYEGILDP
jgi:DTW domain-containing protein YfiP